MRKSGGIFDLDSLNLKIERIEKKTAEPDFWNRENSQETLKELNILKKLIEEYEKISGMNEDVSVMIEFIEAGDDSFEKELDDKIDTVTEEIQNFKTKLLLDEKYDSNNAILTINAGAGGTEACDWTEMLYRMYDRWSNRKDFKVEVLDSLSGEEAGIKSITLNIKGSYAYGYLKGEKGVHRLVRISPFDSNGKRHTSFTAVNVVPEIDDDVEVNIRPEDLKVDTYRASGAGGQHVNTTDSAVRITHIPTNTVVTCQKERSQLKNKETAMKILKSRLFEIELEKREKEMENIKGTESKIEWGSQIRSYVFQPYKMVKDHRTKAEEGNVDKVMDGDIDSFINEYLKFYKN
ncbi:peptide chain release factor 2 [Pseudoleptotrichia goodfellowii]|uniref:Peptide chain release factor 2 n=2 Tax=Pseudoleptotrichia goodfellowii TaxID=157692 RepID=D0GJR6_9FUSO|nr:peptide chain release factor 2 [Pseudoleptotrichia goodfellowii F0264]BBM36556.1 peptide chain release factor 2 [Pseudoleptotrichia goodfellowii]